MTRLIEAPPAFDYSDFLLENLRDRLTASFLTDNVVQESGTYTTATNVLFRTEQYRSANITVEAIIHARDLLMGMVSGRRKMEGLEGQIEAFKKFEHKVISAAPFTATIIDTIEKLKEEGESMSHCIFNSYGPRIAAGEYLAYHISADDDCNFKMPKSGFTVGFNKDGDMWVFDQIKGKRNDTTYTSNPKLLTFIALIQKLLTPLTEPRSWSINVGAVRLEW